MANQKLKMDSRHELVAEKIIEYFKKNNKVNWLTIDVHKVELRDIFTPHEFNLIRGNVKTFLLDEDYIRKDIDSSLLNVYYLSSKGQGFTSFEELRNAKKDEIFEAEKNRKLEVEKLSLEVDALRKQFFDYAETKRKANDSYVISIITVGLAILTLVLQLTCNRHG